MKECERKASWKKQYRTKECKFTPNLQFLIAYFSRKIVQIFVKFVTFVKCFSVSFNIIVFQNLANNVMLV